MKERRRSSCYGDPGRKRNKMHTNIMTDQILKNKPKIVALSVMLAYRGWVRVPCRTRATWKIHWERMLLRSWLTFGWLHIWDWNRKERKEGKWLKRCDRIACCQFHAESLQTWMNHSVLGRAKASTYFQTDWPAASLWRTDCSSVFRTFCKNTQLLLLVGSSGH